MSITCISNDCTDRENDCRDLSFAGYKRSSTHDCLSSEREDDCRNAERQRQEDNKSSNEKVLGIAFVSFFSFACLQLVFAFVAGSDAMLGDSSAMMVDSMTYFLNWIAEKRKIGLSQNQFASHSSELSEQQWEWQRQKSILYLELLPPLVSVSTLLVVTSIVTHKAAAVLYAVWSHQENESSHNEPNIDLMFGFSCFNLMLDMLNVFCFAKTRVSWGYTPGEQQLLLLESEQVEQLCSYEEDTSLSSDRLDAKPDESAINNAAAGGLDHKIISHNRDFPPDTGSMTGSPTHISLETSPTNARCNNNDNLGHNHSSHGGKYKNLNMCSAFTHVFADTLRSLAVVLTSAIALVVDGISGEVADAVAAVIVAVLILLSLMPLIHGMVMNIRKIRQIEQEERDANTQAKKIELV
jgi:Co/Zn/Cd efflux system component